MAEPPPVTNYRRNFFNQNNHALEFDGHVRSLSYESEVSQKRTEKGLLLLSCGLEISGDFREKRATFFGVVPLDKDRTLGLTSSSIHLAKYVTSRRTKLSDKRVILERKKSSSKKCTIEFQHQADLELEYPRRN